jgi:hypothetical protein
MRVPRNLSEFLDFFDLRLLLRCESFEELLLGGMLPVFRGASYPSDDQVCMKTLRDFGLWIKRRFAKKGKKGGRDIKVWVDYCWEHMRVGRRRIRLSFFRFKGGE